MWSQISWNRGIAYMKMRMMIMMMITTMMALSPIMMIVWNYYCQKKQKVSDLIKEFAKRAKQTLVTYDNLQHRKGLGGHMIVLFALFYKMLHQTTIFFALFLQTLYQTTFPFTIFANCRSRQLSSLPHFVRAGCVDSKC